MSAFVLLVCRTLAIWVIDADRIAKIPFTRCLSKMTLEGEMQ